jgi:hypothetical protein
VTTSVVWQFEDDPIIQFSVPLNHCTVTDLRHLKHLLCIFLKNAIYFEIIYLNPKSPYSLVNNYFIVSTFCMFSLHLLHSFSTSYLESRYHLNVLITEMYIE